MLNSVFYSELLGLISLEGRFDTTTYLLLFRYNYLIFVNNVYARSNLTVKCTFNETGQLLTID